MRNRTTALVLTIAAVALLATVVAVSASAGSGISSVAKAGTGSPQTGAADPSGQNDATNVEFIGQEEDGADVAANGAIVDRSLSKGFSNNAPSTASGKKAKSNPSSPTGFEGLNFYQQRYARKGNQFSVEPPDQGLCVGNGYELEAVNDVLNVYDATGASVLPDNTASNIVSGFPRNVNHAVDLNSFYGYLPAINRTTGVRGPQVTDPSCLYDSATQRWFVVVLTINAGSLVNHLDIAVSQTADPRGDWNIYRTDVTNDGTNTGGVNPGPYLGDYPHIGADANGFYITTNAYPWNANGFAGAQIYAFSKAQLAAGAANVTMQHIDTSGMVNAPSDAGATQPGFTVWPAQSPGAGFNTAGGGTEYFLSSNAADEATHPVAGTGGSYQSNQLVVWTMTNTSSLNSATPSVSLTNKVVGVEDYGIPPKARQKGAGGPPGVNAPQGYCINDVATLLFNGQTGCWRLLFNPPGPAHTEVISAPDSNDTRMQQVTYANGKLWGALDTAINPDNTGVRAGIAWFILNPSNGKVFNQGYLGAAGWDFTYPAIGVTPSGRGVMAFTAMGDTAYPSAAYAAIDANAGVSGWDVVPGGDGAAPDDGFTSYKAQVGGNPPRTRWGDYGAAAVDGNSVWVASEYIAHSCDYTAWGGPFFAGGTGDNLLGTCAGTPGGTGVRGALGNWSTRITKFTP